MIPSDHNPEEMEIEKSVAYIVSRYYRAPELILGQEQYGEKIDMWSVGCIMAEMWIGHPVFMGKNSEDQLFRISSVLGKIGKLEKSAMNESYDGPLPEIQSDSRLNKILERAGADNLGIDLLTKVLVYDPEERVTPLEALQHPFFDSLRVKKMKINGQEVCDLFDFTDFELNG
jgi:glycogen synthase kinase 3 beta